VLQRDAGDSRCRPSGGLWPPRQCRSPGRRASYVTVARCLKLLMSSATPINTPGSEMLGEPGQHLDVIRPVKRQDLHSIDELANGAPTLFERVRSWESHREGKHASRTRIDPAAPPPRHNENLRATSPTLNWFPVRSVHGLARSR